MKLSNLRIVDPRCAIILMGLFAIFSGGTVTYINAVLTTLEKRFELNSMEMGALMGANDIGYLTTVVFVAYFGSKKNRQPFMLFLSGVGLSLSCMTYTLPYYIYGSKYTAESLLNINGTSKGLCLNTNQSLPITKPTSRIGYEIKLHERSITLFILMIAGIMNGVASTPFWSLGISFIDDMVGPAKSGIYIGSLYALRTFAPVFGFLLGSHILKYHESLKIMVHQYSPGQRDLKWIGAWWLGWMILGLCVLVPSPFLLLLRRKNPNRLNDDKTQKVVFLNQTGTIEIENKEIQINSENVKSDSEIESDNKGEITIFKLGDLMEILHILKETIQNRIFYCLLIGMIFEIISFISLLTFFTKYLEFHFRVSASVANIMSGICLSGSSMISASVSGLTSYFFKTSVRNLNRYHTIVNIVAAIMFPLLFLFTCPSTSISGLSEESKIAVCSDRCHCQVNRLEPVCYNSTTFFSPCIAGCTNQLNETFYSNCGCQSSKFAVKGFCEKTCSSVYGFLVVLAIVRIIGSIGSVQFTQVLMRVANPKFKAMNLSVIGFVFGICGLTLPPLAGIVLDTACTYRDINRYGVKSNCLIYDNDKMRYLTLGVAFTFQIPACFFYTLSWLSTPKDYVYKSKSRKNSAVRPEVTTQSTNTAT